MKKLSAGVFALCLGLGSTAYADPTTTRTIQKGASASGSVDIDDVNGCIHGTLFVDASNDTYKDEAGSTHSRSVFVNFVGSDDCEGLVAGFDSNYFPLTTTIGAQSFSYNFDVNIGFYDFTSEDFTPVATHRFTGTMTISATGDLEKSHETTITLTETARTVVRSKKTARDADVTVTKAKYDDVKTKFTPGSGSIGETKLATIEVTRF